MYNGMLTLVNAHRRYIAHRRYLLPLLTIDCSTTELYNSPQPGVET